MSPPRYSAQTVGQTDRQTDRSSKAGVSYSPSLQYLWVGRIRKNPCPLFTKSTSNPRLNLWVIFVSRLWITLCLLSVCPSVSPSLCVCPSVPLPVCPSIRLSVGFFACRSGSVMCLEHTGEKGKHSPDTIWICLNNFHFQKPNCGEREKLNQWQQTL